MNSTKPEHYRSLSGSLKNIKRSISTYSTSRNKSVSNTGGESTNTESSSEVRNSNTESVWTLFLFESIWTCSQATVTGSADFGFIPLL